MGAKGIITTKPGGSTSAGKIVVTDDASATGVPTKTPIGDIIPFREDIAGILEGDLVSFDPVTDATGEIAVGITLVKTGKVITGIHQDNIIVGAGEPVLINGGAKIQGKITINGGILVITGNSFIEGKIESNINGSIIVASECSVEGKIEVTGASYLSIKNSTIDGKIASNGNISATVQNCTVRGKLEVLNATKCKTSGNTVEGQTNTPGCVN
jgi:hypothetical protein